jgi:hypothetical protein
MIKRKRNGRRLPIRIMSRQHLSENGLGEESVGGESGSPLY